MHGPWFAVGVAHAYLYLGLGASLLEKGLIRAADGGSGPMMTDAAPEAGFATVCTFTKAYVNATGATGAVSNLTGRLYEFAAPLPLDGEPPHPACQLATRKERRLTQANSTDW